MKVRKSLLILGGVVLLSIGLTGILFSSLSIFFGFLAASVFLIFYGLTVRAEEAPALPQASLCPKCGTRLEPGGVYCPGCGER